MLRNDCIKMKNPRRLYLGGFLHLHRRTAGSVYMPQTLPVLHEAAELAPSEKEVPPETFEAKVEIFFLTSVLPHLGHFTPSIWLEPSTSSSKSSWHDVHTNSYNGILFTSLFRIYGIIQRRHMDDPDSIRCTNFTKVTI